MATGKPFMVGAFVLGGLAIGVISILAFAGAGLFSTRIHILAVFPGSVSGLEVGSPATFRGVKVGEVKGLKVDVNDTDNKPIVYVYIDIEPDTIVRTNRTKQLDVSQIRDGVKNGLRAQLTSLSFVTGQLSVDFDFHPDTPAVLAGGGADGVLEVPTIPSDFQQLKDQFIAMNLPELSSKAREALVSIQRVVDQVGDQIVPLSDGAQQTFGDARTTLRTITGAVDKIQVNTQRTLGNIDQLAMEAHKQVGTIGPDADQLVTSLNDMVGPRSPIREDLEATLRDLAASASSLRVFMHDFQRNPSGTILSKESK
jgi:paraquat-inducible protein B